MLICNLSTRNHTNASIHTRTNLQHITQTALKAHSLPDLQIHHLSQNVDR